MATNGSNDAGERVLKRTASISQGSEASQTAQDYISSQLQLEADAREALPYQFDTCTKPLGPLRQSLYSCLTCNPPPTDPEQPYNAAGVCYSCSISCHGEHELVELFSRRNFVCDCGTTRMPNTSPCSLRINPDTGSKGDVCGEEAASTNAYNHNFRNRFCGCGQLYDPHLEKGTMFQCLGIGTVSDGGCGEDWWHPECLLGLGRNWQSKLPADQSLEATKSEPASTGMPLSTIPEEEDGNQNISNSTLEKKENGARNSPDDAEETPLPPGFPSEDSFDHLICYKCTSAFPWIKQYSNLPAFISVLHQRREELQKRKAAKEDETTQSRNAVGENHSAALESDSVSKKRKAEPDLDSKTSEQEFKRARSSEVVEGKSDIKSGTEITCKCPSPSNQDADKPVSLFLPADFRDHICRCPEHFDLLTPHPQLLEEEEPYEPPISESGEGGNETGSLGSRSLLDRGEAALSNMDRVRAIEGVMAYNHVRDKVKDFLKPFAESGTPVGAEDIKAYFARLRGDEDSQKSNTVAGSDDKNPDDGEDHRREQSGY